MPLDLANDYSRKDSASASNVYYAYTVNPNAADGDKVFAIRKVSTTAGVETITWTNGNQMSYSDSWTSRTYSFGAPAGTLGFTYSKTTTQPYVATFNWSAITGVSKYVITAKDANGALLDESGNLLRGPYVTRTFTTNLTNVTLWSQPFISTGTYSVTLTAQNVAGVLTASYTINFS